MFVNDDIYYFLSDVTENGKRKEGLMTCFVIHVSLLSLHNFLETAVLQKSLSFNTHPKLSLASVGFLLITET